jgi:N-acetylglutamate synthase-like GNAT family acetyltransferase
MIREATERDIPRIVEMGSRSLREGPYSAEIDNPEQTAETALQVVQGAGKVLLAEENNKVVGLLGFIVNNHFYTGERTAVELMWYVEPEFRKSWTAVALLRRGHAVAKEMGAKKMQCAAPTEEVGKAYEALGYSKLEVAYQRTL